MTDQPLASALTIVASALNDTRRSAPVDPQALESAFGTLRAWRTISGVSEVVFFLLWLLPLMLLLQLLSWLDVPYELFAVAAAAGGLALIPWGWVIRNLIDGVLEKAGATRQLIAEANSLLRVAPLILPEKTQR